MNILTTSQKSNEAIQEEAKALASSMHMTYIKRGKTSIPALFSKYQCEYIAVLAGSGLTVQVILDKKGLSNRARFTFLDCTIGLGSDSMVVSYGYPQAQITGLEGSLPIWLATSHGLAHYIHSEDSVTNALRRIKVNHDTFEHYLPNLPDNSIDIIYFDPMFEVPVEKSPQFKPLRGHTVESHIDDKIMSQAMRVATYGVIIKERPFSSVFQNYPPHQWVGGSYY